MFDSPTQRDLQTSGTQVYNPYLHSTSEFTNTAFENITKYMKYIHKYNI